MNQQYQFYLAVVASHTCTFGSLLGRPHPLILLRMEKDGATLQTQPSYLPDQLYIYTHHFRRVVIQSASPKSGGCAQMAFSLGEGRDEVLYLSFSESISFNILSEEQGLCLVSLPHRGRFRGGFILF